MGLDVTEVPGMSSPVGRQYRATAIVSFPKVRDYVGPIVDSIATHDMTVHEVDGVHHIVSPFGTASFQETEDGFKLTAEASEPGGLNRLKHALVGPISFIAARETPVIAWDGDHAEPALPDDLRVLHVTTIEDMAPRLRRIVFRGENLGRYDRDDQLHCRLIFQQRGVDRFLWPMLDHRGHIVWPNDAVIPTRVYTIRRVDLTRQEITVDFAIHPNAGPATQWALKARAGDVVGILGPAANGPRDADVYVLAGDETALPGIARIVESLAPDARGVAFIEVDGKSDELPLHCPAGMTISWLHRNGAAAGTTSLLEDAVRSARWPDDLGRCFFWGGCEHKAFSAIHRYLRRDVMLPKDRMVFYSHWHRTAQ